MLIEADKFGEWVVPILNHKLHPRVQTQPIVI